MSQRRYSVGAILISAAFALAAEPANFGPEKQTAVERPPVAAAVFQAEGTKTVVGRLIRYSRDTLTIHPRDGGEDVTFKWAELTPECAYSLRLSLIDRKDAEEWLNLGRFGWSIGAKEKAREALAKAVSLDPALEEQAEQIRQGKELLRPAQPKAPEPPQGEVKSTNLPRRAAPPQRAAASRPIRSTAAGSRAAATRPANAGGVERYSKATPEEHEAALTLYREMSKEVQKKLQASLVELETPHFLIFTDWDKREYAFLKENVEAAYTVVSRQFDISPKENIFVGKLPIYMFADNKTFMKFGREIDRLPMRPGIGGYFAGSSIGIGHMAMPKPDRNGNVRENERQWGYVLTHEFTHAFVARYRTNRPIPTWLNEGLAEVIASQAFPDPDRRAFARRMARAGSIATVFDDGFAKSGEYYPVMQTLVEVLLQENPKAFLQMFNGIKDGMKGEEALRQFYKIDYPTLERGWREYAKRITNQ